MTDSRLPGRWLTDVRFEALSDRAFRTFCGSLMWSNEHGTDGAIPDIAMKYLHPLGVDAKTRTELITAALWRATKSGVQVPDWTTKMQQSAAATVEQQRENNRNRQRAHRARKRSESSASVTSDVTRDVLGQDRQGQDRQGKDEGEAVDQRTGVVTEWPTAVPGRPGESVELSPGVWSEAS